MCGRYALFDIEPLEADYELPADLAWTPNYNVAPTQSMPVVTQEGVVKMRWGLIPKWAKDDRIGNKLINARSESVFVKPIWRSIITKYRCLIPANGFYEWQKSNDGKRPFFIRPTNQRLFMFAGIWETWRHNGTLWHSYSILTTTPNQEMSLIHDRMPVIIERTDHDEWLGASSRDDIEPFLKPYPDSHLDVFEVNAAVNDVKTNNAGLILPETDSR
ncbi:MAG: SOS response-associated peptidase [Candidatus Saccharibacteria bacterium]